MNNLITRGLEQPRERWCLAACIGLCAGYIVAFWLIQRSSIRIDDIFFARRREFLAARLLQNRLPPGRPVPVTQHSQIVPSLLLLSGWSDPEAAGVWTDGPHAAFAVALPQPAKATAILQVGAFIMVRPGAVQTIRFSTQKRDIGTWRLRNRAAVLCAALPAAAASESGVVQVDIDIGSPQSPEAGSDPRKLGLKLTQVELLTDPSQCDREAEMPVGDDNGRPGALPLDPAKDKSLEPFR